MMNTCIFQCKQRLLLAVLKNKLDDIDVVLMNREFDPDGVVEVHSG